MNDENTAESARLMTLPDAGTYWTTGTLQTAYGPLEAYATCARCGSIVNSPDRHEDWHRLIESAMSPSPAEGVGR